MLAVTRRNRIRETIQETKSVTVSDLAIEFSVTEETIRRDLKILEDEGILTRTYGGAFIQDGVLNDINLTIRENMLVSNKKDMAEVCKKHIFNGDSIYLDPSTTCYFLAEAIQTMRLTVLTDSLKITNLLASSTTLKLLSTGGKFSTTHMSFVGGGALKSLERYYVDKAFLSCRSLNMQHGITDSNEELSEIRQAILGHANEVYLVADYSKFDKVSFWEICQFRQIDYLVTDHPLSEEWKNFCQQQEVEILLKQNKENK